MINRLFTWGAVAFVLFLTIGYAQPQLTKISYHLWRTFLMPLGISETRAELFTAFIFCLLCAAGMLIYGIYTVVNHFWPNQKPAKTSKRKAAPTKRGPVAPIVTDRQKLAEITGDREQKARKILTVAKTAATSMQPGPASVVMDVANSLCQQVAYGSTQWLLPSSLSLVRMFIDNLCTVMGNERALSGTYIGFIEGDLINDLPANLDNMLRDQLRALRREALPDMGRIFDKVYLFSAHHAYGLANVAEADLSIKPLGMKAAPQKVFAVQYARSLLDAYQIQLRQNARSDQAFSGDLKQSVEGKFKAFASYLEGQLGRCGLVYVCGTEISRTLLQAVQSAKNAAQLNSLPVLGASGYFFRDESAERPFRVYQMVGDMARLEVFVPRLD